MAENSKIEWTDHTFNPWYGCTKVSPACDHCYAEAWSKRTGLVIWGQQRRRTGIEYWKGPRKWNAKAEAEQSRRRVFCASLADVFDNQVPDEWRRDLWVLIRETPELDWLMLTKRPQNVRKMLPADWVAGWANVWIGTTAEDQRHLEQRWDHLAAVPARVRFLSYEPALDAIKIDFSRNSAPDWVICGGESGGHARPMRPEWARSIRDQCCQAGIPFFFKQWGEHDQQMKRVGKKHAGALLDGRLWRQFPLREEKRLEPPQN